MLQHGGVLTAARVALVPSAIIWFLDRGGSAGTPFWKE
jgi:hypothetical protein